LKDDRNIKAASISAQHLVNQASRAGNKENEMKAVGLFWIAALRPA
jgi:hypothetical protein